MKNPFERRPRDGDVEAALRASLDAHARLAPPGDGLAEQIIASATSERRPVLGPPRRAWGRFTLPAAAAVLAAIIGITVAIALDDPGPDTPPVAEVDRPTHPVAATDRSRGCRRAPQPHRRPPSRRPRRPTPPRCTTSGSSTSPSPTPTTGGPSPRHGASPTRRAGARR